MASTSQHTISSFPTLASVAPAMPSLAESLVVLTQDAEFLATLRAVVCSHQISTATAEADLALQLLQDHGGVAVIDTAAVTNPIAQLTEHLKSQFPDLVLVVAGGAEDQAALSAQIGNGTVYRFLHKPISEQRVKLFVDAAWRRHGEEHAGIVGLTLTREILVARPPQPFKKIVGICATVAVCAIGVLWFGTREPQRAAPAPAIVPASKPALLPEIADVAEDPATGTITRADATSPTVREGNSTLPLIPATAIPAPRNPVAPAAAEEAENKRRQLVERLVNEAHKAFAADDADEGERWIQAAREARAAEEDLDSLSLEGERTRRAQRAATIMRLSQQFNERMAQSQFVEPTHDSAKFYLTELKRIEADHPATRFAHQALSARLLEEARTFVSRQDLAAARRWLAEARDAGAGADSIAAVEREILVSQDVVTAPKPSVPVTAAIPKKIHHVDPEYPVGARERGVEGWVDVALAVQPDGSVGKVNIVRANPTGVFDKAAIAAVRKWRYEPAREDAQTVERHVKLHMLFQLK